MAVRFSNRDGRKKFSAKRNSNRGSSKHSRLPLQPAYGQRSHGDPDLQHAIDACLRAAPVSDDAGGSPAEEGWEDKFKSMFGDGGRLRIGSNRHGQNSDGIGESRVQTIKEDQPAQFTDVSDRYWDEVEETDTGAAEARIFNRDEVLEAENNHAVLSRLRTKSLLVIEEVLDTPLPPTTDPNYARILSAKKDAAGSIVNASLKADENCFRQKQTDALKRLYDAVKAEKEQGVLIESSPEALQELSPLH